MTTQTYCGAYGRTEDQELFKRTVHAFVEREIVPTAHDCDEREAFPWPNVRKMSEIGLWASWCPRNTAARAPTP